MKTILVTGANGFIGSHTLDYLDGRKDIRLIAACRDKAKLAKHYTGETRIGDLRDKKYLPTLLEGVDVVVNCMAWTSLWKNRKRSEVLYYQPVIDLIDQYVKSGAIRFVNVSTTAAASPSRSSDAMSVGIQRKFWPHLCNVIKIENYLRDIATTEKSVVNMRLGIFAGENYGLGVLPILLPRLKTHLVPWVNGGRAHLSIADGRDYGQAMGLAALVDDLGSFNAFNIVGKEVPTMREIIDFLHTEFNYPKPHFSVPFFMAYPFAWLMEKIDPVVPWEPLIVRSIIHLLEETHTNNDLAISVLGYKPVHDWREAVRMQVREMEERQLKPMKMAKEIT